MLRRRINKLQSLLECTVYYYANQKATLGNTIIGAELISHTYNSATKVGTVVWSAVPTSFGGTSAYFKDNTLAVDLSLCDMTVIPDDMFINNAYLRKVFLNANTSEIKDYAFSTIYSSSAFTSIGVPDTDLTGEDLVKSYSTILVEPLYNLTTIGNSAFSGLAVLDVSTVLLSAVTIGNYALNGIDTENLIIPNTTTSIGEYLHTGNIYLRNLVIGTGLTELPTSCFGSNRLATVTIPSNILTIGMNAFINCSLNTLILNEGLKRIEASAFANCRLVTNTLHPLVLPSSIEFLGSEAFKGLNNGNLSAVKCEATDHDVVCEDATVFDNDESTELVLMIHRGADLHFASWQNLNRSVTILYLD